MSGRIIKNFPLDVDVYNELEKLGTKINEPDKNKLIKRLINCYVGRTSM